MSIKSLYQICKYYDYNRDESVLFTNYNINALKLNPKKIILKFKNMICHCIINTSSMQEATVLVPASSSFINIIKKQDKCAVSLKYCFIDSKDKEIEFFVNCSIESIQQYEPNSSFYHISLLYTNRPSNELIARLGGLLEINKTINAFKTEYIDITEKSILMLSLQKSETYVSIFREKRKSIIKSLSFTGAKVITVGIPAYLIDKSIALELRFSDTYEVLIIEGVIHRSQFIDERRKLCIIDIIFNTNSIPFSYKSHLNKYFMNKKNDNNITIARK